MNISRLDLIIDWDDMTVLQSFTSIEKDTRYRTLDRNGNIIDIHFKEIDGDSIWEYEVLKIDFIDACFDVIQNELYEHGLEFHNDAMDQIRNELQDEIGKEEDHE